MSEFNLELYEEIKTLNRLLKEKYEKLYYLLDPIEIELYEVEHYNQDNIDKLLRAHSDADEKYFYWSYRDNPEEI